MSPFDEAGPDSLVWSSRNDGNFSVNSAHHVLANPDSNAEDPLFKIIWKWKGMERIKVFLWLMANEALHTNAFRQA